jgi:hypothetical protein
MASTNAMGASDEDKDPEAYLAQVSILPRRYVAVVTSAFLVKRRLIEILLMGKSSRHFKIWLGASFHVFAYWPEFWMKFV